MLGPCRGTAFRGLRLTCSVEHGVELLLLRLLRRHPPQLLLLRRRRPEQLLHVRRLLRLLLLLLLLRLPRQGHRLLQHRRAA